MSPTACLINLRSYWWIGLRLTSTVSIVVGVVVISIIIVWIVASVIVSYIVVAIITPIIAIAVEISDIAVSITVAGVAVSITAADVAVSITIAPAGRQGGGPQRGCGGDEKQLLDFHLILPNDIGGPIRTTIGHLEQVPGKLIDLFE
jgi:hypothetical protein